MTKSQETGHAKNVANYETIVIKATSFGQAYNPTKLSIKVPALNAMLTASKTALAAVSSAEPAYKNAVAAREQTFEGLPKHITRVYNALRATDASSQVTDNALTLVRKLQGRRASRKLSDDELKELERNGNKVVQISASQIGFDNRIENFDRLIKLLVATAAYNPNETDLKTATLTNMLNDMKAKNTAVKNAEIPLLNARISRNNILYAPGFGYGGYGLVR